jgi:hypothetical protein
MQWKKSKPFKKNKQVLAHITNHFFFKSLEWQDKVKEDKPIKCVNKQGR